MKKPVLWLVLLCTLFFARNLHAFSYTVTGTADNTDSTSHGGSGTAGDPFQMSSLRGAILHANANVSPHTISLPPGTYSINGELPVIVSGLNLTLQGTSGNPADTILSQTQVQRFIETAFVNNTTPNNVVLTCVNLTFTGGQGGVFGGGVLLVGGLGSVTTVSNCVFTNNKTIGSGVRPGGVIVNSPDGDVIVQNCVFQGNSSVSQGGAIYFLSQIEETSGHGNLTVTGSSFVGNSSVSHGGAIAVASVIGAQTITRCNFTGNSATTAGVNTANGGAIVHFDGTMVAHYNRFFNNTAATPANGNTLYQPGEAPGTYSFDAADNWWGANSGPGANDINAVSAVSAGSWLQLEITPGIATLSPGGSTTLTADLLNRNAGGLLAAGQLVGLPALPDPTTLFHNSVLGTLSVLSSQFVNGVATATFTAGAGSGIASAQVTLDNQTVTATMAIPVSVSSINRVTASPSNLGSVQWTVTFSGAVSGVNVGNFALVSSGLGGTPAIASASPVGATPTATWTVTASTGSGNGTLGLNMINATGVSVPLLNLTFTGQVYTLDRTPPTVTGVSATTADGSYTSGSSISVTVGFTKNVVVTGTPRLQLNSGASVFANYASGSGSSTLTFTYLVGPAEDSADLDYSSTSALSLSGGTLADTIGNTATLTLPSPGAAGSLGANKNIVIQAATTTAVISAPNPTVFGQTVALTATVTSLGAGTPTGTVTFTVDGSPSPPVPLVGGVAILTTSTLAAAPHNVTATYSGDVIFLPSTSTPTSPVVFQAATATTLVSAPNPSVFGQTVTLTATVSAVPPGAGTPTGTTSFFDGATLLGTGTINPGGQATFTTSALAVGAHSVTAVYAGDINFTASTSPISTPVVNQAATTTGVTSTPDPSVFGQTVTLTATVNAVPPGAGTPAGTASFFDGATLLGTATLNGSGVATFATSALAVGTHSVTAVSTGSANFTGSTSPISTPVVSQAATTTTLVSAPNPSVFGQAVTLTATVSAVPPGAGTPAGTASFFDGATLLGSASLNGSGVAALTTATLALGSHSVTAVYAGNANFTGSTSPVTTPVVNQAATTTTLVSVPNPSVFGQAVTLTATVTAVAPGGGTPAGTASFFDGATLLGTGTLNGSGVASFTTSTLAVGSHSVTAVFSGNVNFTGSMSPVTTPVVNQAATATTVVSAPNPSVFGQSVTFTATVSAVAPGAGTPVGTASFFNGAVLLGTATLNGTGQATFTTSTLAVGAHSLTAIYSGNANFTGSTSPILAHSVNQAATATIVVSSVNPSGVGQTVSFTATVSAVAPGAGTPAGTASFFDGATLLGTGTLDAGGQATLSTTALGLGTHSVTTIYAGNASFTGSASAILTQNVICASPIYVDAASGNDANSGTTPASAKLTIQAGIDAVCTVGTVFVKAGTYNPSATLLVDKDLSIVGDSAITTIVSGSANGGDHVFSIHPSGASPGPAVVLSGLTVENGISGSAGGGIANHLNSTLSVVDCTISANHAVAGGGIANSGNLTIANCTISGNQAAANGGGIFNDVNATLTVTDTTLSGNQAAGTGGGLANLGSVTVDNGTITGNQGIGGFGGLFTSGTESLNNCIVAGNFAGASTTPSDIGGGPVDTASHNLIGDAGTAGGIADGVNGNIVGIGGSGTLPIAAILNTTLANNGGPTLTHALVPNSPALDSGVNLSDVQQISVGGVAGTFTLTFNGQTSAALPFNATAAQVQTALNSLSTIGGTGGSVAVAAGAGTYTVTFGGTLAGASQSQLSAVGIGGVTVTVTTLSQGLAANDQRGVGFPRLVNNKVDIGALESSVLSSTSVSTWNRVTTTPSSLSSVQWTASFANPVSGVTAVNFAFLNNGLGGSPAITGVTPVGSAPATTWTVSASTGTGDGQLAVAMINALGISVQITGLPASGQIYTIDRTPPTVLIGSPSASFANGGPVSFTVTYADANFNSSSLASTDITVNKTGTANNGGVTISGSGLTRTVTVSGLTGNGTLGISLTAGTATDLAGNLAPASGPSATFTVDNTPPTTAISAPSATLTAGGPVSFTVTYADANFASSTLAAGNVILNQTGTANGSVVVSGSGNTRTVTLSSITGDGALGISLPVATATDLAGNSAPAAGPSATFAVDNSPPTIAISAPSAPSTAGGPVAYTVTYNDPNFNASTLAVGNITLNRTGTANGVMAVSGSGATRTVTLSGITGNGSLGISLAAGTATDTLGHTALAAGPSSTFVVDNTAPTVVLAAASSTQRNSSPFHYTAAFSKPVTGFSLAGVSASGGSAGNLTSIDATHYAFDVTPSGQGTVSVTILPGAAQDQVGNQSLAGNTVSIVFDNIPPTVTINQAAGQADPTTIPAINYTVVFSEPVSSFVNGSVTLSGTARPSSTAVIALPPNDGTSYRVTVSGMTAGGTVIASIGAGAVNDLAGNGNLSSTSTDNTVTFVPFHVVNTQDSGEGSLRQAVANANALQSNPTIDLTGLTGTITLQSTLTLAANLSIHGPGASHLKISGDKNGSGVADAGDVPVVLVNPGVTAALSGLTIAQGYGSLGGGIYNSGTLTVNLCSVSGSVATSGAGGGGIYNQGTLTVNQSTISGNVASDGGSGGVMNFSGVSIVNGSTISGNSVQGGGGGGVLNYSGTVALIESTITGNSVQGGGGGVLNFSGTLSVNQSTISGNQAVLPTGGIENSGTLTLKNSIVAGNSGGDISGSLTPDSANNLVGLPAGVGSINQILNPTLADHGGPTLTLALVPGSPAIDAGNSALIPPDTFDLNGNGNTNEPVPFDQRGVGFARVGGASVDIGAFESQDTVPPAVAISTPSNPIAGAGPVTYTVTYTDTNFKASTLSPGDISLTRTGTANGSVAVTGSGNTRTVTLSNLTGDGTLGISIGAGTASDTAGNQSAAAGPSATFTVDNTAPAVVISNPSAPIAAGGPVTYTIIYTDPNFNASTLAPGSITLNKTGTANGSVAVAGSGNARTVTLSGLTGDGTLGISIAAGTASDTAGNLSVAAGPSATFTVDNTAPAVAISSPSATITAGGPVTYTVTYSDPDFKASTLASGNITLNKTGTANGAVAVAGSGNTRTVTISGLTGDGTLGISIVAGTASDTAGNLSATAGPSVAFTVDHTPPAVLISAPSVSTTVSGAVSYTVTYTDANFGSSTLAAANVTLNATETATGVVAVSGSGSTRTVTISSITGHGTLGISLAANTAVDQAGNAALAAGPSPTFIVNHPPVAGLDTITRAFTEGVEVPVATLLSNDTDADGDVLTLTALQAPISGQASVSLSGTNVVYTPNPGFAAADTFTYTVSDTRGGVATGTVNVKVTNPGPLKQLTIDYLGGGTFLITVNETPGKTFTVQYSTTLTRPTWQNLRTVTTDAQGTFSFEDTVATTSRFYRLISP